jgi:hypothetical protein
MRETPDSALAFERYYDLGEDRTLALLAQKMRQEMIRQQQILRDTKPIPTEATLLSRYKKWSKAHKWQEHVIQRDRAQAEKDRKKRLKAIEQMNDEHSLFGRTQAMQAVRQIKELIDAKKLGAPAAVQLFKYATDLERVARGAATEVAHLQHTGEEGGPIVIKTEWGTVKLDRNEEEI